MHPVTRRALAAALGLGALAAVACQPPPPIGSIRPPTDGNVWSCDQEPAPTAAQRLAVGLAPCGVAPVAPDADGALVIIDSISWQAQVGPGLTRPGYGAPGWTLQHAMPYLRSLEHPEDVNLAVATGTNEGNPALGGWDAADTAALAEVQQLGLGCVAFVAPALGPVPERFPGHRAAVAEVRERYLATGRPVAEWQPDADRAEVVSRDDGIHLTTDGTSATPTAAAARNAVIEQAVQACL